MTNPINVANLVLAPTNKSTPTTNSEIGKATINGCTYVSGNKVSSKPLVIFFCKCRKVKKPYKVVFEHAHANGQSGE